MSNAAALTFSVVTDDCGVMPAASSPEPPRPVQQPGFSSDSEILARSYDAAKTTRHNSEHWTDATQASADTLINQDLNTLRNRARYEIRNNSFAKGIVDTLAFHIVGKSGPALQLQSGDDAVNDKTEGRWLDWSNRCDIAGRMTLADMLKLTVSQFCDSGEALFAKQRDDDDKRHRLKLLMVEPDRLESPWGKIGEPTIYKGIERQPNGKPIGYYINRRHPGDTTTFQITDDFDFINAKTVYHLYRQERPGQSRGVPWMAPALELFAKLRRYTLAVVQAAEQAANITGVMKTNHPEVPFNSDQADDSTFDEIALPRNSLLTLPMGWDASGFDSTQPSTVYTDFVRAIINEMARCVNMPLNVALGNSEKSNFASGRLDIQVYRQFIESVRHYLERHFLGPLFEDWTRETRFQAGELGRLLVNGGVKLQWMWPEVIPHIQPKDEEIARDTRLKNFTSTYQDEYAKKGQDWRRQFRQIGAEKKALEAEGITAADLDIWANLDKDLGKTDEPDKDETENVVEAS